MPNSFLWDSSIENVRAKNNVVSLKMLLPVQGYGTSHYLKITPGIALSILEHNNYDNRVIMRSRVELYKARISSGQFGIHAQGIVFSENGRLLNGQHRLKAIAESAIEFQIMAVVFDEREDSYKYMDTGAKRHLSDLAKLDRRTSEVVSFIHRHLLKNTVRVISVEDAQVLGACINPAIIGGDLNHGAHNVMKLSIRAAFVYVWFAEPSFREHAKVSLNMLRNPSDFSEIFRVHHTYMRLRTTHANLWAAGSDGLEKHFLAAINLFYPNRTNLSRLPAILIDECRLKFRVFLSHQGISLGAIEDN